MLSLWSSRIRPNDMCLRSPVLDLFAQHFPRRWCYACYCVVIMCVCVCVWGPKDINFYVDTTNVISSFFVRYSYVIDYVQSIFNYNMILVSLFQLPLNRRKDNDNTEALHILLGSGTR
jgi:hypothetical protein